MTLPKSTIKSHKWFYILLALLPLFCSAQNIPTSKQLAPLILFIDGYNKQDFDQMRQPLAGLMKLALTKKNIKTLYGTNYLIFGKAKIINTKINSDNQLSFELVYEKDTTESQRMGFALTRKNKIIGINTKSLKFQYPKTTENKSLSEKIIKDKIDSIVQIKYATGVFNGCIGVIHKGNLIYKNCVGNSNFETKMPLNDSSMFDLASCSKQFTAAAILILAEQNKLALSDNIQKYIPNLPYKNISIEALLNHTSGLPDYEEMLDKYWDKQKFATNNDVIEYFNKYKPKMLFKPGSKFEYCNTGYALLSVIIEKVSGMSYAEFLATTIFQPLGMKHSRVYNTRRSNNESISNYAYGYVYSDSLKKYVLPDMLPNYNFVIYMDAITGDGTVNSTVADMVLWEMSLRNHTLISKSSLDKAFTRAKIKSGEMIDYGYGWELFQDAKSESIAYHSGSWPGYITFTMHFIDCDNSIIILTNNEYVNTLKFANKIATIITK
jgi:CubicO group peptidase (beta-lactamase class C family)